MARYTLPNEENLCILVGYDDLLNTFYAIVKKQLSDREYMEYHGRARGEIQTIAGLRKALKPHCPLPKDIADLLLVAQKGDPDTDNTVQEYRQFGTERIDVSGVDPTNKQRSEDANS